MVKKDLFIALQYLLPHHLISRGAGLLAECKIPAIKNPFTNWFVKQYGIDMSEAQEENPEAYATFNDFFTRALKDGMRPLPEDEKAIVCPADGAISQIGDIKYNRVFQAKGHDYSLTELVGGDPELAREFEEGKFATVYLSPRDYHRVHMPVKGTLRKMIHVPGRLFSVNQTTAENVPRLFARNERAVCIFDTERGPMAVILVGAMIVASIETVWAGLVTPHKRGVKTYDYTPEGNHSIVLERGAEMGRFKLGSTAIVLFGKDQVEWAESLGETSPVRMGQAIG
ncbi:archaetidylserine decarboxylase [Parendozoicomonas haliclonae]|uniref:archaetidylserine decarboxylase n=1 Tax=Parendozoicomonas haliclonae TaxID=1960125 RepID=UPI0039F104E7